MSRLREHFKARLNHQQHNNVRRIVDIKETPAQFFVLGIASLSVIHSNRNQRKQSTEMKRKEREAIELPADYQRLQRYRSKHKEHHHLLFVTLIMAEKDDRPCRNQIRPVAEMRQRDQASKQYDARAGSYPAVKQYHDQQTDCKRHHHIPMCAVFQNAFRRAPKCQYEIERLRNKREDDKAQQIP